MKIFSALNFFNFKHKYYFNLKIIIELILKSNLKKLIYQYNELNYIKKKIQINSYKIYNV